MKQFLVEFREDGVGARIIKDPKEIELKLNLPNVLLNPNLSKLRGISPSYWKLAEGGEIEVVEHPKEQDHYRVKDRDAVLSELSDEILTKVLEQTPPPVENHYPYTDPDFLNRLGALEEEFKVMRVQKVLRMSIQICSLEYRLKRLYLIIAAVSFLYAGLITWLMFKLN